MRRLTDWFDPDVKPVRVGDYERDEHFELVIRYWDGAQWRYQKDGSACQYQQRPWRGIRIDSPFSPNYTSQLAPVKKAPPAKKQANPFDGNDARARMACVRLPKTHPHSRADHIRRSNSKV